jgi:glutamate synthase (NADPH/NADH)
MAQGAKPGEGGELPGYKVLPHIAKCRNSTPGVGLISPPPHHDIYSIEDLAQLIHDCKNANPEAKVSVKLVSELGVGVVAAGVAKCKADHILVAGAEGGTGASKWTGIKSAGCVWELGLAETHQTLVLNGLRGRVSLETDGQLRTGRDVVVAALLGAEHFGFATAPLIAMGCIMMRKCHMNTCPVGIATQDPALRAKFKGQPEHVVNYLWLIAEEVRTYMSQLGFRSLDEMVGRADVLTMDPQRFFKMPLVLEKMLTPADKLPDAGIFGPVENRRLYPQDHSSVLPPGSVCAALIDGFQETLDKGTPLTKHFKVRNLDRTVGTGLSGKVYRAWGDSLPAGTCHAVLEGTSGQSLGAFLGKGIYLELIGDAQDYFAKGLSGGVIAVYPPKGALDAGFKPEENVIIGNTALYGATTGAAFVNGICAERFAVRNSGAWAVVEGTGDHGCEYMTGGRLAVLGETGSNFAAGMSGGVAWVWNPDKKFEAKVNTEMVELSRMQDGQGPEAYPTDQSDLKELLEAHLRLTGSGVAEGLLARWPECLPEFVRVFPTDYADALLKSDRGTEDIKAFRTWVPATGDPILPENLKTNAELLAQNGEFTIPMLAEANQDRPTIDADEKSLAPGGGFLRYSREGITSRPVEVRVGDFAENYDHKDEPKVKTQAARCMDCGTPFCHQSVTNRSGCPLGNLIPEWNALVKRGEFRLAFERLRETNNFPEFTGRVCPAPCEASCTLGLIDDPVSIKSTELYIVDEAYRRGWMNPRPPPNRTGKRIAIIGSGPAGLAAADELNRMGHSVTVYERSDRPGGLMMYGVPNMKTDKLEVVEQRARIMEEEGINFICGPQGNVGKEGGPTAQELIANNDAVLLATGATVARDLDTTPGRDLKGVHLAMEFLHSNTKAILDSGAVDETWRERSNAASRPPLDVKGKNVVVIGGGDTGNDCIGTSVRHGAVQVHNLELMPKPPPSRAAHTPWPHWPDMQRTDYGHNEAAQMLNNGEDIRTYGVLTKEFLSDGQGNVSGVKIIDIEWKMNDGRMQMTEVPGTEKVLDADAVFLALGFVSAEGPMAKQFAVKTDGRGNYETFGLAGPGKDFQTSNPKVFAAGDCRRGQSLVVWGIAEGRAASQQVHQYVMTQPSTSIFEGAASEAVWAP